MSIKSVGFLEITHNRSHKHNHRIANVSLSFLFLHCLYSTKLKNSIVNGRWNMTSISFFFFGSSKPTTTTANKYSNFPGIILQKCFLSILQGLPLHIQIDTFEDHRDAQIFHRGYCQIKVFCDKVSYETNLNFILFAFGFTCFEYCISCTVSDFESDRGLMRYKKLKEWKRRKNAFQYP